MQLLLVTMVTRLGTLPVSGSTKLTHFLVHLLVGGIHLDERDAISIHVLVLL